MYYVGLTRKPICLHEGCSLPAGSCIFPQIDERGCVRTAQMIAFDDEGGRFGHRSKRGSGESLLTWMHTVMMAELMKMTANQWGWDDNRRRKPYNCITGAHLLNEKAYPALVGKTVGIVESVSTALCMTCAMPDIVWLATAGASGIRLVADAIKRDAPSLASRNIIVYPDEGKTDQCAKPSPPLACRMSVCPTSWTGSQYTEATSKTSSCPPPTPSTLCPRSPRHP